MSKSINDNQKNRGRPSTGFDPMWGIRFTRGQREAIDSWAKQHGITRAEAIRRLIKVGLQNSLSEK